MQKCTVHGMQRTQNAQDSEWKGLFEGMSETQGNCDALSRRCIIIVHPQYLVGNRGDVVVSRTITNVAMCDVRCGHDKDGHGGESGPQGRILRNGCTVEGVLMATTTCGWLW